MLDHEIAKAYDPSVHEDAIYVAWEKSGFFNPDNLPGERKEAFSIVLPPPNVTGTLHIGHAVMLAIEDIMIRFARMRGKKTLWLPGTDHAAIATSTKVENLIFKEEGKTRHDLGREEFLKRVEQFAADSHDIIVNQAKKMGASLDWSREAYTLDVKRNHAVNFAFKKMYDDGLIYRGHRVVNWDPVGQTTISDIEIVYKEVEATLYTFKYSKDFPIAISSTRPETKVGDTAIAVHPNDERYKKFVGKTFENISFAGATLSIKVVADDSVDPTFGTGALGVTPAHSLIDADIAQRHGLQVKQVIGADGKMTEASGSLVANKTTIEARELIIDWLKEQGLIEGEETTIQNLATAERSGGVIEPIPMLQWFIDVNKKFSRGLFKKATLKTLMQDAVRGGKIKIIPERFEKSYFDWVDNLRDWCISRQLWFGHRVPVWYCVACGKDAKDEAAMQACKDPIVSINEVKKCPHCGGVVRQDPDTLDTWFSAGMWTFTTLGWPEQTADLKTFHPTSVLETGYDILFFWVVRMILMTTYLIGEVPFKQVYLHGLVRDEKGRKMSKSLDNIIDPLDMISAYGADATRLSLVIGSTPGNDTKLSEEKIAGYRNFTNKLWNISRFVLGTIGDKSDTTNTTNTTDRTYIAMTLTDRWILGRLAEVITDVTKHLEAHELSSAGELLRDFTWNDFADWYLEIAKIQKQAAQAAENTDAILLHVLETLLKLWHPFMPFVTEAIWQQRHPPEPSGRTIRVGEERRAMLLIESWPEKEDIKYLSGLKDEGHRGDVMEAFASLQEIISAIRNLRLQYHVEPVKMVQVTIVSKKHATFLDEQAELIKRLARVASLTVSSDKAASANSASAVLGDTTIFLSLEGLVDTEKEKARLSAELAQVRQYVAQLTGKLSNAEFVSKAPETVVLSMKQKLQEAEQKVTGLEQQIRSL